MNGNLERRKVLILCGTYYQLIMAIQMRKGFLKGDEVTVLLYDASRNSDAVCERLRTTGFFDHVHHFPFRERFQVSHCTLAMKLTFLIEMVHGRGEYERLLPGEYDMLLCYHASAPELILYATLQRRNHRIKFERFEEGILTYYLCVGREGESKLCNLACLMRKMLGRPSALDAGVMDYFYCCYPEIYKGVLKPERIARIGMEREFTELLCRVFAVDSRDLDYREKYIFLTSMLDVEGGEPIGEFELVEEVSEVIDGGKENLLVKMHPRDTRTVYEKAGFHVDRNSDIPWEVLQLVAGFSDKVLLTVMSGSALSANMVMENPPQTYFLYPLCRRKGNDYVKKSFADLEGILENSFPSDAAKHMHVAHCMDDILGI